MSLDDVKLSVLAFPQRWSGADIELRMVLLPRGNPLEPLVPGTPAFADARMSLAARFVPGLDAMPTALAAADAQALVLTPPGDVRAVFESVAAALPIVAPITKPQPRRADISIKKALPPSYTNAFAFESPRTPNAVSDDHFACVLRGEMSKGPPAPSAPTASLSWGQAISFALRRPMIAERMGLIYSTTLSLDPATTREGGWIYILPGLDNDYAAAWAATPDLIKVYAARLPPLNAPRALFAATLFPVNGPALDYVELFVEAEGYDDGFAKIVHAEQPSTADVAGGSPTAGAPAVESGIAVGWDDEQLVIWQNRQIDPSAAALQAPLGVLGYRIDVREVGTSEWCSLTRANGRVAAGKLDLGAFDGELALDVVPSKLGQAANDDFWLPRYFATWRGKSLLFTDDTRLSLDTREVSTSARQLTAVLAGVPALHYGKRYQFRVRLVDLSGGGPSLSDASFNPAPAPIATAGLRRFVRPHALTVGEGETKGRSLRYSIARPTLDYPMVVFSGARTEDELLAALPAARAGKTLLGAPDPNVSALRVTVEAQAPVAATRGSVGDSGGYQPIYETDLPFPDDPSEPLTLSFEFNDVHTLADLPPPMANAPLPLPSGRELRVRVAPRCGQPGTDYFGNEAARTGPATLLTPRQEARDERGLWRSAMPAAQVRAFLLQPPPRPDTLIELERQLSGELHGSADDLLALLAQPLRLRSSGLEVFGAPGERTVFAAAEAIRHSLSPDHGSLVFSAQADLLNHWIVAITLDLDRDWTWEGLGDAGVTISREGKVIGAWQPTHTIHASTRVDADRTHTRFVFFDAIDPKPQPGLFPSELSPTWTISPSLVAKPTVDPPLTLSCRLPIAVRPVQVPRILSAGIALSPYQRGDGYASSDPRAAMTWLELDAPPENPGDAYFARILAHGTDPLLSETETAAPDEPSLPIDPELIRMISPGQSDDGAGLGAMTRLVASPSPVHFLLPAPPSVAAASPDLLGFYTYELRVGHVEGWSTAQARFGPPLRVAGLQHPPPPLRCDARFTTAGITVSAPTAIPTSAGRNFAPTAPQTSMQFLLYAQVRQADGLDWRNVLLSRKPGQLPKILENQRRDNLEVTSMTGWSAVEINKLLGELALPRDLGLSVLAVELFPSDTPSEDPLGADLGHFRILRSSPLVAVGAYCPTS